MQTLQNENFRLPEDVTTLIRIGVQLVCIILDQRIVFQFIVKKKKKEVIQQQIKITTKDENECYNITIVLLFNS